MQIGEELLEALAAAAPSIKPNVLHSLGSKEGHIEDAKNTDNFKEIVHEKIEAISNIKLDESLIEWIEHTRADLLKQRQERLHQARITFIVALLFLILSLILVLAGIILIFTSNIQVGVITSVSNAVSGIVSGLAFTFNKQANDRLDEYSKEMNALDKSHIAMQYIAKISDIKIRDEALNDLAQKIYASPGDKGSTPIAPSMPAKE
jgi:hypothetical protein